ARSKGELQMMPSYLKSALAPLRFMLQDRLAVIGLCVLSLIVAMALVAPLLSTHDPRSVNEIEDGSVLVRAGDAETGVVWRLEASLGDVAIQAADGDGAGNGIAVGREGTAYRFTAGQGWSDIETPL